MKRLEFLKSSLSEGDNVEALATRLQKEDKRFLRRHTRELEDSLEDMEVELENRLRSDVAVDKATLDLFSKMENIKEEIKTTKSFQEKYV